MDALGLMLELRPGRQPAIVRSPRPDLPALLALGQAADRLPDTMAMLHTLCAAGHRLAATLALQAARGQTPTVDGASRQALRLAVAREQLLRMAHDWPRSLPDAPPAAAATAARALQDCPLWHGQALDDQARLQALPGWLQQRWLGQALPPLVQALEDDPVAAVRRWATRCRGPLPTLLTATLPRALALRTPRATAGEATHDKAHLVADTGPWNRLHDPRPPSADNAGMRLIARLHDLLRLALPDGQDWLHASASCTAPGMGEACVEVGRGLLHYRVGLDGDERVAMLRLQSPTDCNFHPQGVLALALAGLQGRDAALDAQCLAAAFDPCEPVRIVAADAALESGHA